MQKYILTFIQKDLKYIERKRNRVWVERDVIVLLTTGLRHSLAGHVVQYMDWFRCVLVLVAVS